MTADLGAENSSAAGFSTGNVLDELTAELEAQESSSASVFSTGNAVGRSIEDTQLWSADDEKALMITPIGQQAAAGSVSSLWQHLSLALFAVLAFSSLFEHTSALNSSMQAGSLTGTQFVLERIWPLLWLGLGGLVAAAGYRYLPALTQHSLRQLSVDANDTHSKEEIHKRMLREYCVTWPLTSVVKILVDDLGPICSGDLTSRELVFLMCRCFLIPAFFLGVVFWFEVSYEAIWGLRRVVVLSMIPILSMAQLHVPYNCGWFTVFRWQVNCVMLQTSLSAHLQESTFILALFTGAAVPDLSSHYVAYAVGILPLCARIKWGCNVDSSIVCQD